MRHRYKQQADNRLQLLAQLAIFLLLLAKVLLTSGLLPAAFLAIILNLILPEDLGDEQVKEIAGGHAGEGGQN